MQLLTIDPRIRQSSLGWINLGIFFVISTLLSYLATATWSNPLQVFMRSSGAPMMSDEAVLVRFGLPYLALLLAAVGSSRPSDPSRNRLWILGIRHTAIGWYVVPVVVLIALLIILAFASWLLDASSPPPWQMHLAVGLPAVDTVWLSHVALLFGMVVALVTTIYGLVLPSLLNQLPTLLAYVLTSFIGFAILNPTEHLPMSSLIAYGPLLLFNCWLVARSGSILPVIFAGFLSMVPRLIFIEGW